MQAEEAGPHTLITIRTLDFAVVTTLGAVSAEMSHLVTISTCDSCWVARLIAFLAHVTFLATVAAVAWPCGRTVFGKVSHCKLLEEEQ